MENTCTLQGTLSGEIKLNIDDVSLKLILTGSFTIPIDVSEVVLDRRNEGNHVSKSAMVERSRDTTARRGVKQDTIYCDIPENAKENRDGLTGTDLEKCSTSVRESLTCKDTITRTGDSFYQETTAGKGDNFYKDTSTGKGDNFYQGKTLGKGVNFYQGTNTGKGDNFYQETTLGKGDNFFQGKNTGKGTIFSKDTTTQTGDNFYLVEPRHHFRGSTFSISKCNTEIRYNLIRRIIRKLLSTKKKYVVNY